MERKYLEIWSLAKPYYEKGRVYDLPHIEWMMQKADEIADVEKLDKNILIPLCILHDIGYSAIGYKNPHVKSQEIKKLHMAEGAKIAAIILDEVSFDRERAKEVSRLVSVHDNWVLGDDQPFKESKEMAVFNDLDFMWPFVTFDQFRITGESMGLTPKEEYKFWENDEKFTRRPLCCAATKELFNKCKKKIQNQLT